MHPEPKVSVIIRCFNEAKHIGRLLRGISEQTLENVEIIVVDSGSSDATLDMVSRSPARVLSIEPEEFSFGRALNRGCAQSRGEFLVFASAHVYPVYRDWLERLVAPFTDPKVGLAYGRQRGDHRTKYSEHQVFAKWFPQRSEPRQSHPFCNNANAAIRRALWNQLPYDEEITGLEDLHWARRLMGLGQYVSYVAEAEVVHVHEESPQQIFNRYRREAIAMKQLNPDQRFGAIELAALFSGNVVTDGYHALRERVLLEQWKSILLFRLMQFGGTYRGYSQHGPVTRDLRMRFYYPASISGSERQDESRHEQQAIDYGDTAQY